MKKTMALLFGAAAAVSACFAGTDVPLIEKGKSGITIIVENPENPVTKMAGEELRTHLQKRTGAVISVAGPADACAPGTIPFYLGLSERTKKLGADPAKIGPDGYFLKATPEYVLIAGRDNPMIHDRYNGHDFVVGNSKLGIYALGEAGTLNGVYKFLENQAGVRWYMPGDLGTIIPESPDFRVPETMRYDSPAYKYRYFFGMYFRDASPKNLYWYRRLCAGGTDQFFINHSYQILFHKFKDTHPEYFALIDGKRDLDNLSTANHFGSLCFSNPDVVREFAAVANDFFDKNPDLSFPVVPQDGMFRMCECPECRKLYSPELGENGKFSNAVFSLASKVAKEVAKKHPDRFIGTLAYERHRMPPEMELPPNLFVRICYERSDLRDPAKKREIRDVIAGFHAKNVPVSTWTYPLYLQIPPFRGLPIVYPELLQEDIRFNRDHGVFGEFAESSYNGGGGDQYVHDMDFHLPGITHLNHYLRQHLFWNPDLDMKALLEEYYRLFYGPASAEMRNFWETARDLYVSACEKSPMTQYKKQDLEKLYSILDEAAKKAGSGNPFAERIALIRSEMDPFLKPMLAELSYKKLFTVPFTKEDISFDGDWKEGKTYTLVRRDGRAADPAMATTVAALANEKGLALRVEAKEPAMDQIVMKTSTRDHEDTWRDDCFEIYLVTADRKANLLYIVTAGGNIYDHRLEKDPNLPGDLAWSSGLKLDVKRGKDGWNFQAFLPWSDLRADGKTLPPMRIQIYRRRTGGDPLHGDYYSLFPVLENRNYSPELFPEVRFMDSGSLLPNGSFEEVDENGKPLNWENPQCFEIFSGESAPDGKRFARVTMDAKKKIRLDYLSSRPFPVAEGTDYTLKFRHRGWEGVAYVLFFDGDGKQIQEPNRVCFSVPRSAKWTETVFTGRVPGGVKTCRVIFRSFEVSPEGEGMSVDAAEFFGNSAAE